MKQFSSYQYVGGEMNERDKKEVGSKFWNEGKWNNFVLPFLPKDCSGLSLVDVGCNAGIFLKQAEDKGFETVIGVESDREAVRKGQQYRKEVGGNWKILGIDMRAYLEHTPVVDYTVLAMAHYYLSPEEWKEYLEKLKSKSRFCIIVTAKKKPNPSKAASDTEGIMRDMKDWKLVGEIKEVPEDGDPYPRKQWSFCFANPDLVSVDPNNLDNGNAQQRIFLKELDKGIDPLKTDYHRRLSDYRSKTTSRQGVWTQEEVDSFILKQVALYEDIKINGILTPIEVEFEEGKRWRVRDGNHRHDIAKHLGYKKLIVKKYERSNNIHKLK